MARKPAGPCPGDGDQAGNTEHPAFGGWELEREACRRLRGHPQKAEVQWRPPQAPDHEGGSWERVRARQSRLHISGR